MHRVVFVLVILAACGKVNNDNPGDGPGPGSDMGSGGGPCTSNDQCAAPTPVCDTAGGTCVECVQSDQCAAGETCDLSSHTCRACSVDADCASDVCDTETGTCVDEANVVYASPAGAGNCDKATPCSIGTAVAVATQTRDNIKLAPGSYSAQIVLANKTLAFFGVGATINAPTNATPFEVNDGGHLRIVGAALNAIGDSVVRCEGDSTKTHDVELFRTALQSSTSVLLANPCTMSVKESVVRITSSDFHIVLAPPTVATFDRTHFIGIGGAGLAAFAGCDVHITNSLFTKVGDPVDPNDHGALAGGTYTVEFSTFVDTFVECGGSGATLTLSSSILRDTLAGGGDTLRGINSCTSAKFNVVFPSAAPLGATNLIADPQLKNIAADDYHLLVTSPALDHGDPASTVGLDFDGTARPQGAGRDSGAFEFKP